MIVITGAAGMIGSAVLWGLNERGMSDLLLVDNVDHDQKEGNIGPLRYEQLVGIDEFREQLREGVYDTKDIEAIIHLGAISSTSESSWEKLQDRNVDYSQTVIRWCIDRGVRCIYASSGQTYGLGEHGYSDDHDLFDSLQTRTLYGKSKLLVDIWARDAGYLDTVVGLRYFNVFGPNEYHKGDMRSVVAKEYERASREGEIHLFKSYREDYADGEQKRDFLYLKDAVAATLFFLDNPKLAGVYNVGTGTAETWNALATALSAAVQRPVRTEYVEMPEKLREGYQYFTEADIAKLRQVGFSHQFTPLDAAVTEYVQRYLSADRHLGEDTDV